jgi:hypothetical protein
MDDIVWIKQNNVQSTCINDSLMVWFCNSTSFVLFESHAKRIFQLWREGCDRNEIKEILQKEYIHSEAYFINKFVDQILAKIWYYNRQKNTSKEIPLLKKLRNQLKYPFLQKNYQFGSKTIKICYILS